MSVDEFYQNRPLYSPHVIWVFQYVLSSISHQFHQCLYICNGLFTFVLFYFALLRSALCPSTSFVKLAPYSPPRGGNINICDMGVSIRSIPNILLYQTIIPTHGKHFDVFRMHVTRYIVHQNTK